MRRAARRKRPPRIDATACSLLRDGWADGPCSPALHAALITGDHGSMWGPCVDAGQPDEWGDDGTPKRTPKELQRCKTSPHDGLNLPTSFSLTASGDFGYTTTRTAFAHGGSEPTLRPDVGGVAEVAHLSSQFRFCKLLYNNKYTITLQIVA